MKSQGVILTGTEAGRWYRTILEGLRSKEEEWDCLYLQVDFDPINALLPYRIKEAAKLLEPYFVEMEKRISGRYILANITLHEAVEYFENKPEKFLHLDEILVSEPRMALPKIGLLGTAYTMQNQYWEKWVVPNCRVELPEVVEQEVEALRKVYYQGKNAALAKSVFEKLRLLEVDAWMIACTELALAYEDAQIDLPLINLPELQCSTLAGSV